MAVINIRVNGKKVSREVPDSILLSDFLEILNTSSIF